MADKARIYKANITLSDTDRHYYDDVVLTIALHPSETLERMMVRLLAYCFCAAKNLTFTRGLSSADEPDLWLKSDDGRILEWIEVGQPALDRLKKARGQSEAVKVFAYGRGMEIWWSQQSAAISALPKVTLNCFAPDELKKLTEIVERTMNLSVTIAENTAYVSCGDDNLSISLLGCPS